MSKQIVTARLTEAQAAVLREYADQHGMTFYRAVGHAIERGIAQMIGGPQLPRPTIMESDELEGALGLLQAHADRNERFARQGLFAAGAAYAAIVAVARSLLPPDQSGVFDEQVAGEAARIFERQVAKAMEE